VDRETLDQVITLQIMQLQQALQESNHKLEQRVAERTLQWSQAVERLTELNRLKANFISTISHELRTPLTHLKGYLELLTNGEIGPLTEDQQAAAAVMLRSEMRLERLIDDLIQFSLVSRGEMSLNASQVRLSDLARAAVLQIESKARSKNINLEMNIKDPLPEVVVDEEKIGWVVSQLLDNAIKFTPTGGYVVLSLSEEQDLVKVTVSDNGIGIPPERSEEIFIAFHQLDSSSTRQQGGTGLGLALARRILEAHGSDIEVQSTEGKGACFSFSLPCVRQAAAEQSKQAVRDGDESN
jgi:signal transduction histidine kinase